MELVVRDDLTAAQAAAWRGLGEPDSCWTGAQRVELTATVIAALTAHSPLLPWVPPSSVDGIVPSSPSAPSLAHDVVYRIARHASTLTESWYRQVTSAVGEVPYVELVALTCQVAAVWSFCRGIGAALPLLPVAGDQSPTGRVAPDLVRARLSWVPVAAPADARAAVVQAFTAVPDSNATVWALADAQYMPDAEMVHPDWTRATLSRPQMELIAMTVSRSRECFY